MSLYSLCKNTGSNVDATIYIEGLDDISYQTKAEAIAQDLGIPAPTIAPFDAPGLEEYARLTKTGFPTVSLLPLLLPNIEEERVLFLDADTLVMGNVSEVWDSKMDGRPLGACTGIGQVTLLEDRILTMRLSDLLRPDYSRHKRKNHLDRILSFGFLPGEHYFNSGVLLMDCQQIRSMPHFSQLSTMNKLIPYIHDLPDQDRLNELFAGNWYQFPLRWNVRPGIGKDVTGRKRKFRFASDNIRQQMVEAERSRGSESGESCYGIGRPTGITASCSTSFERASMTEDRRSRRRLPSMPCADRRVVPV